MDSETNTSNDPASAFEALRGEISLLRRAVEGLTAERQAELIAFIEGGGTWSEACTRFGTSKGTIGRVLRQGVDRAQLRSVG